MSNEAFHPVLLWSGYMGLILAVVANIVPSFFERRAKHPIRVAIEIVAFLACAGVAALAALLFQHTVRGGEPLLGMSQLDSWFVIFSCFLVLLILFYLLVKDGETGG